MGKKSANKPSKRQPSKTMKAVEQQRQAQAAKDRRRRLIIIIVIVAVVALTGAMIAGITAGKKGGNDDSTQANNGGKNVSKSMKDAKGLKTPGDMPNAIVVGKDGIGGSIKGVPTINSYFSYGCPGCIRQDHFAGSELFKAATEGKLNLVLYPVSTHGLAWTYTAGDAALKVADNDPDKFIEFHEKLMGFANDVMYKDEQSIQAQGNGTLLADEQQTLDKVKEIGKQVGLSDKTVDSFQPASAVQSTVDGWTNEWVNLVQPIAGDQVGTPMIIRNADEVTSFGEAAKKYLKMDDAENKRLADLEKSDPEKARAEVDALQAEAYKKVVADWSK